MKKSLLILSFIVAGYALHAQEEVRTNAIKLNPLSLFFLTGNISYEKAVGENQSIQIGGFYSGFSLSGLKYSGFGIIPEYRFYFAGQKVALNGVYAAPFLRYQSFSLTDTETDSKASFSSIGGGAVVGWEKTWSSGFVLNLFAGPSYNSGTVKSNDGQSEFDVTSAINGFGLRSGVTLGFAF